MLSKRLRIMAERYHNFDIYSEAVSPEFDRGDLLLKGFGCQAKRTAEYILAQPIGLNDDDRFVGRIRFNGCVEGEIYNRSGYKNNNELISKFYKQPFENLCTYDSQHSTADFGRVIAEGLEASLIKIEESRSNHAGDPDGLSYLDALETVIRAMIARADLCAAACEEKATFAEEPRRSELLEMARILHKVPAKPAETFREAIQSLFFLFQFLPDSIGTPDRYLYSYYRHDLDAKICTEEEMKEYIQELFVTINAFRPYDNLWSGDKGGESHFSLGGFTPDGKDGFNDLSRLIITAMMELPLYRPQVSLRWTPETPIEVLYFVMDAERNDFFKRIALVNDVPRVKMLTNHIGMAYEDAIRYTMIGCNEPAIQGAIYYGGCKTNMVRSLTRTLYDFENECIACEDFDAFFEVYRKHYEEDMKRFIEICDGFNLYRSRDVDMISSILLNGPIEKARSATRSGLKVATSGTDMIGWVTVIDSLCVIRQFVYEEKRFTMAELIAMLRADWNGFEEIRREIYRTAKYHGNDDPLSREVAAKVSRMIRDFFTDKRNVFGFKFVIGNQIGYCAHHTYFGKNTPATPDGRHAGDNISFGGGQGGGRDRKGLTALLNSVADMDPACIVCGPCVTNVMLDESLIRNDSYFRKTVSMVDSYFRKGGLHIQLNYVSREELIAAQREPHEHENLRVRVSGFSGYFTRLDPGIQREIIDRTVKS